ncbi:hypothetical protein [Halosolutus gelatinilyticus]|uniref:hypothetical protein n=1 Tax=Halosolutus gelatinilyticus TaxID=2931975 RepID=UPI001FF3A7DB|nr:hypothetical protein [Halosolutus gelatinilyticus]
MSSTVPRGIALLLCCLAGGSTLLLALPASPLSITGDEAEPPQLSVSSFERVETGCADDVATYASSSHGNGSYTRVSFIETGTETADLSARTERTSPPGADLHTFRVSIDSTGRPRQNDSCAMGVQYRLELTHERGSSEGLLSGDDGIRVLWLENGEYSGCSATTSGSLDAECHRFTKDAQSNRTWANTTATG